MYRKTTPSSYPNTAASNFTDSSKNWRKHSNFYRRTSGEETASLTAVPGRYTDSTRTWRRIKSLWRYTGSVWQRIHYKNANQPLATVAPTIRYNSYNGYIVDTYETDAEAWWATDPYQPQWAQMGPGPSGVGQDTWYLDSNDNEVGSSNVTYLWGKDGVWVNDTGATTNATFVYNYEPYASGATEVTDDEGNYQGDKLRNSSAVLGTYDDYYIWYRISKTVGSSTGQGFSQLVKVTKQEPKPNSFTMVSPGVATVGTPKVVSYSISNKWWRSIDTVSSVIEWHELDYSSQAPDSTTLKTSHAMFLTNITTDSATTLAGTDEYTPQGSNKYILAKLILKNSYTDFPPVTEVTRLAQTTVATAQACGPFSLSNAQKFARFYDASSGTNKRQISVNIGQSSNADRYELQVKGYGPWDGSSDYYFPVGYYTTLLTYDASPYFYESNRSNGTLTATVTVSDYRYYEITARAKFGGTTDGSAISNNTVYPPGVAPSAPSIYSISSNSDYFGTYIQFSLSQSSWGSNTEKYYEYSLNDGVYSQISTSTYGTLGTGYINEANGGKIYVNSNTSYTVRIRATNYDLETSSVSNQLSVTTVSPPTAPTNVVVKSFSTKTGHIFFTSGSNTGSVDGYLDYDSFSTFDSINNYVNIGSNTAGVISLTGANSSTQSYTSYLRAWGSSNKTGPGGTLTSYGTRVLNGGDYPSVMQNTPTLGTDPRTINFSWSGSGATNKYSIVLFRWTGSSWVQLAASDTTSTSIQYTSADGVDYNTQYYLQITAIYEYASGVSYTGLTQAGSSITTGVNLSSPTISSVTYNTSNNTWTVNYTGGSGPYYQIWYQVTSQTSVPNLSGSEASTADASSSSSTSTSRVLTPSSGNAYYWWVRSAKTLNGTGVGNVSAWNGPVTMSPMVTSNPTLSGTTKVGQTLTYGIGSWINATSYDLRLYRGTQNVATFETLAASTSSTSGTYTIPSSDFTDPNGRRYYRSFTNASNGSYSSGFVGGTELGPLVNLTLYTVSFNANGGSSTPSDVTQTSEGGSVTLPGAISQSGFTFGGWNTNQFGTGTTYAANSQYTPTSSLTLWAKWTSNAVIPTITMGSNSGVTSNQGTINWSSTNQSSWSSTGTFSGSGTTQTSVSKTGLTASTTYTGTVTVTSSTGNTASANYSLTTSAAATPGAITVSSISASKTATRQITGTWSSSRTGTDTSFSWWNTRVRNTSSGAVAKHTLFSETPRSDSFTSLTGTSYRFGIQGVIYDNAFSTQRYSIGTSDEGSYAENSTNINPQ